MLYGVDTVRSTPYTVLRCTSHQNKSKYRSKTSTVEYVDINRWIWLVSVCREPTLCHDRLIDAKRDSALTPHHHHRAVNPTYPSRHDSPINTYGVHTTPNPNSTNHIPPSISVKPPPKSDIHSYPNRSTKLLTSTTKNREAAARHSHGIQKHNVAQARSNLPDLLHDTHPHRSMYVYNESTQ